MVHPLFFFTIDCPLLALTGTADEKTQETICKEILLKHPCKLFVSPNRSNLRFSVSKVKKKNMLPQLDWLISMIKEHGIHTPKTIIFCDTIFMLLLMLQIT
jgi:superfamily II DNA helicase RecQ